MYWTNNISEIIFLALIYVLEYFFPLFTRRENRLEHSFRNASLRVLNLILLRVLFVHLLVIDVRWAREHAVGLLYQVPFPAWAKLLAGLMLYDLWMYLFHRACHKIPFLWRFHRIHHSDTEVDVTTAFRFHVGETVIMGILSRLAVIPLLGLTFQHLILYELIQQPVNLFHHSNLAWPEKWDRIMRLFLVSPNMHRVHHSQWRPETNSNYSILFPWWDHVGGTFRLHENLKTIKYGLSEFMDPSWQTIRGMLKMPLAPLYPPKLKAH